MSHFKRRPLWSLLLMAGSACAGDGLTVPDQAELWPQFQARVLVQVDQLALRPLSASPSTPRLSLLGDYYPALPWLASTGRWAGGVRATGGLVSSRNGLSLAQLAPGSSGAGAVWQARVDELLSAPDAGASEVGLWPYLGVGYTGLSRRSGWGFAADVGIVAHVPSLGLSRPAPGANGLDDAVREIRLSPMIQLGVRYAF